MTDLPAYPWQRERYWTVERVGSTPLQHPLLGSRVPAPTPLWSGPIEPTLTPWLTDHRVAGSVVMPATGYVEMALAAGCLTLGKPAEIEYLDITSPLVIPWADASAVKMHTSFSPDDGILQISSTDEHVSEPRPHVRARVRALLTPQPAPLDLNPLQQRCPRPVTAADHYAICASVGLTYGPAFRVLTELHRGDKETWARYDVPQTPEAAYTVQPALLDGALQAGSPLLEDLIAQGHAYLPAAIGAVRVWSTPPASGFIAVTERCRTENEVCWDITLTELDGTVTAQLDGCRLRRLTTSHALPLTVAHTVLRAAPRPGEPFRGPAPVHSPEHVISACCDGIAQARNDWRQLRYAEFEDASIELWARDYAAALASLLPDGTRSFTPSELLDHGMQERHLRLLNLMRPEMERRKILHVDSVGRFHVRPAPRDIQQTHALHSQRHPRFVSVHALATMNIAGLAEILRGRREALQLLTDDASAKTLELIYDIDPVCRFHNRLARLLLEEIVRTWPSERPLRILEVGAGTGGLTAALLPILPAAQVRYSYTDASAFFFSKARMRFTAYDFIEYRTFDLNVAPVEQGFEEGEFDVVVAGNALHTAQDMAQALRHVARLLAPGGALLATESHTPEMLASAFGLLDSFYSQTDTAVRPRSLLLSREEWPGLLKTCGFEHVAQTGEDPNLPGAQSNSVLLATRPRCIANGPAPDTQLITNTAMSFVIAAERADELPLASALSHTLSALTGINAETAVAPDSASEWQSVLTSPTTGEHPPAVVLLLAEASEGTPDAAVNRAAHRAEMLRTCAVALDTPSNSGPRPQLWVVTRPSGAVEIGLGAESPADAALWALSRCAANEQPSLQTWRVSMARSGDVAADALRLAKELLEPTEDDEIVLTRQGRFVPREQHRITARPAAVNQPYTLQVRNPGLSYELVWQEIVQPVPGPGEVLIDVKAAALNYRDIMRSTGLLPAEASEGGPLDAGYGMECAGLVVACGQGVSAFKPGDRVACLAPASLSSHTVTQAHTVFPLPPDTTFTEGATVPAVYSTILYSLGTLARLQAGETLLVHGAAGGVGLAALRYATACGARVIATAGSDLKRNYLRALGVQHVLDSRSLYFADQVRHITAGRGVDVVLNSLAGEAMTRSLELLRPGGRFLELGKRDFYENKALPLRPFSRNIAFYGVDLLKVLTDGDACDLMAQLQDPALGDVVRPLPHSVFPAARVQDAFSLLQHSRHIGKVVVAFDDLDERPMIHPIVRAPNWTPTAPIWSPAGPAVSAQRPRGG